MFNAINNILDSTILQLYLWIDMPTIAFVLMFVITITVTSSLATYLQRKVANTAFNFAAIMLFVGFFVMPITMYIFCYPLFASHEYYIKCEKETFVHEVNGKNVELVVTSCATRDSITDEFGEKEISRINHHIVN